jgi:hypothetical protein
MGAWCLIERGSHLLVVARKRLHHGLRRVLSGARASENSFLGLLGCSWEQHLGRVDVPLGCCLAIWVRRAAESGRLTRFSKRFAKLS